MAELDTELEAVGVNKVRTVQTSRSVMASARMFVVELKAAVVCDVGHDLMFGQVVLVRESNLTNGANMRRLALQIIEVFPKMG